MTQVSKVLKSGGKVVCYGMWVPSGIGIVDRAPNRITLCALVRQDCRSSDFYDYEGSDEESTTHRYALPPFYKTDPIMTSLFTKGSTMGSHADLVAATNFLAEHRIVPTVSHVIHGLENAEEGFEIMKKGDNAGKIVITLEYERKANL